MKRFIKTLAGKTILFVACIISVCLFVASIAGIVLYIDNGEFDFYKHSENKIIVPFIEDVVMRPYGFNLLWNIENGYVDDYDDAEYQIITDSGTLIAKSTGFKADSSQLYVVWYGVLKNKTGSITDIYYHDKENHVTDNNSEYYSVSITPKEGSSLSSEVNFYSNLIHIAYWFRYTIYFVALFSLLMTIACFVALMYASGRKADTNQFFPGPLHKIPFDLLLAFCIAIGIGLCYIGDALVFRLLNNFGSYICIFIICLIGLNIFLGLCVSASSRIKQHAFTKNMVLFYVIKLIWKTLCNIWNMIKKFHNFNITLMRKLPLIWKTAVAFFVISVLELCFIIMTDGSQESAVMMLFIEKLLLFPIILYLALMLRNLQKSGKELANGDLSYHTDTKGMIWDFKQHGEDLNRIANGMAIAVEERLKSERMKTELITNVSHDIKTPLTSIINYASLISSEISENEKITEYSLVLVRQSEKLKRLIEDLVEASKASTGNLEVLLAPCDAGTFLTQASGEYEEKMQNADLTLITKQPDKELHIMADGRRMWRVFDNLMNNICKYGQAGTRVYLSLEEHCGNAFISFKNTSREPLDMSEEELMERFTRGDSSRNTEGNGLGLSIAKSMTELQGGRLKLSIDGDLFKAILIFPLIK